MHERRKNISTSCYSSSKRIKEDEDKEEECEEELWWLHSKVKKK